MASFSGRIKSGYENVQYKKTGATVDYASPIDTSSPIFIADLTSGTGANQADIFFRAEITIASGATATIDLNGGANMDIFGTTLAMLHIVDMMVINAPIDPSATQNTTVVTFGGGTNPVVGYLGGTNPVVPLNPGDMFKKANTGANGLCAVVPGSADTLTFVNATGPQAKVQICVIGRSS